MLIAMIMSITRSVVQLTMHNKTTKKIRYCTNTGTHVSSAFIVYRPVYKVKDFMINMRVRYN